MSNKVLIGIIVFIVVVFGAVYALSKHAPTPKPQSTSASLASLNEGPAPWPVEAQHLPERMKAIDIALLAAEANEQHIHSHLDIVIDGKAVTVPAEIGVTSSSISPVHTHDTTGIIHVESPYKDKVYTLGQFFDIWGVRFSATRLGSYTTDDKHMLTVYSNGKGVSDPVNLPLRAHEEIFVSYGVGNAPSVPASYDFPSGL